MHQSESHLPYDTHPPHPTLLNHSAANFANEGKSISNYDEKRKVKRKNEESREEETLMIGTDGDRKSAKTYSKKNIRNMGN
jgi:hypothetical protein